VAVVVNRSLPDLPRFGRSKYLAHHIARRSRPEAGRSVGGTSEVKSECHLARSIAGYTLTLRAVEKIGRGDRLAPFDSLALREKRSFFEIPHCSESRSLTLSTITCQA